MKNLADVFGKPVRKTGPKRKSDWVLPTQVIGVEIEAENKDGAVWPGRLTYWNVHEDHSLQRGAEWVLNVPLKGDDLSDALEEFYQEPTRLIRHMTGSTHIHLDMTEGNTNHETVKSIVFMMFCLENVLYRIGDPGREYCGYTNKLVSAPEALLAAAMVATEEDNYITLRRLCADEMHIGRYYGLNLMSLNKYGSIEFRYFPTATSFTELEEWINLVMSVKKAALAYSVEQLSVIFSNGELYERWVNENFAPWATVFLDIVPFATVVNYSKKLGANIFSCVSPELKEFNPDAVLKNPVLKRFVQKTVEITPLPVNVYWDVDLPQPTAEPQIAYAGHGVFYHNLFDKQWWPLDKGHVAQTATALKRLLLSLTNYHKANIGSKDKAIASAVSRIDNYVWVLNDRIRIVTNKKKLKQAGPNDFTFKIKTEGTKKVVKAKKTQATVGELAREALLNNVNAVLEAQPEIRRAIPRLQQEQPRWRVTTTTGDQLNVDIEDNF